MKNKANAINDHETVAAIQAFLNAWNNMKTLGLNFYNAEEKLKIKYHRRDQFLV